ncbi:MAG TPA: TusE/DsrC/DsvC family sulfur relay protein [Pseudomonadales bacterium]|nr:TusE/DsrC/DsvC family sulfur relay protein [Pseudomonadales bacterium]
MNAPALDKEGFLRQLSDWSPEVAARLAENEGIVLTEAHWEVINVVRDFYDRYHISPATRVLVKIVGEQLGSEKGRSVYLMQLFSSKAARLVSKIGGLPKPANCD